MTKVRGLRDGQRAPRHAVRYSLYNRDRLERMLIGERLTQSRKADAKVAWRQKAARQAKAL